MPDTVSQQKTLSALSRDRLKDLGRALGVSAPPSLAKDEQVRRITSAPFFDFRAALREFTRDELREACRLNGLDDSGRARIDLASRILDTATLEDDFQSLGSVESEAYLDELGLPTPGEIVACRQRQYLVEDVERPEPSPEHPNPMSRVRMVCLDDDAPGRVLEVLWELELGARVLRTRTKGLGDIHQIDPPRHFAAYLNALKWNCVTATDAQLFQSPFRAGIKLLNHQLTPLQKALKLPRANLFIADDVGLGKTIEAGLVLQELILRQRVNFTLIICPASVVLQWRDEMRNRFGLQFEIYSREFIARRRRERGFRVNPWATHSRFIISHNMIRRPEHRDPLLQHLGERIKKSLLILDEAHAAAPASATKYAVDSQFTRVIRDVAPRFENRLFLSATPHNGHSNSFAALLELLDPQRFTRGVPVESESDLEPVMVRRLKSDLRELGFDYPERRLVKLELRHDSGAWTMERVDAKEAPTEPIEIARTGPEELELARMLAEYTAITKPQSGQGKLVFINLQKRLLSSVEAFFRTLRAHARGRIEIEEEPEENAQEMLDVESYGPSDEAQDEQDQRDVVEASKLLSPTERASELREQMLERAQQLRHVPDAKVAALLHWIRENQCPGVGLDRALTDDEQRWSDARLLIFTEYGDTKRYLQRQLEGAVMGTDQADVRIRRFHGGMSDESREEVQRDFNDPNNPVRILIATDAAREGVNLQGACADLLHYDLPWNPARLEQRNGRIDRTLQPSPVVRCMYFAYPQRPEDRVLEVVVQKIEIIQRELGSLGAVVMDQMEAALQDGIDDETASKLEKASQVDEERDAARQRELESQRQIERAKREIDSAGRVLNQSRKVINFNTELLKDALDVACELTLNGLEQAPRLVSSERREDGYEVPTFPESWQETIDTLRRPRGRGEPPWEWRDDPPLPVVFEAPDRISAPVVHLHLEHPFVQRMLQRFRSQGFAANDLSRVSILKNPHDSVVRVIAFGRLSLFGKGATRLHDELVPVAAPWFESKGDGHLVPGHTEEDEAALARLDELLRERQSLDDIPMAICNRLQTSATEDFAALWPAVEEEAEARTKDAEVALKARAGEEAQALEKILLNQQRAIQKRIQQTMLPFAETKDEQRQLEQFKRDAEHMEARYRQIEQEIATEPYELLELFEVELRRLEPIGLVYLWPETR